MLLIGSYLRQKASIALDACLFAYWAFRTFHPYGNFIAPSLPVIPREDVHLGVHPARIFLLSEGVQPEAVLRTVP